MSKKDEALKLALEALEWINRVNAMDFEYQRKARESLNAIYEALAEQPAQQQEPTATELSNGLGLALHDAVLIRIGGSDEATKQACARIDKLVEKYRAEHPDTQPAQQQEPAAWMYESVCGNDFATRNNPPKYAKNIRPLGYTSPPAQRKPLTDEEIESINVKFAGSRDLARLFARAIEAAHGIKGDA